MLEFTIVAGPNGAGKSTLWPNYIRPTTEYFNGDLVLAELHKRYPQLSKESLGGGVAVALERAVDNAILEKKDFAFESNFSTDMAVDLTEKFKNSGYHTRLVYLGIDSLSDSKDRVFLRRQRGGHDVSTEVIEFNFTEGTKKVNENLYHFDTVFFVDNQHLSLKEAPTIVAYIKDGNRQVLDNNVEWFNSKFKETFMSLQSDNLTSKENKPETQSAKFPINLNLDADKSNISCKASNKLATIQKEVKSNKKSTDHQIKNIKHKRP